MPSWENRVQTAIDMFNQGHFNECASLIRRYLKMDDLSWYNRIYCLVLISRSATIWRNSEASWRPCAEFCADRKT